jgi:hypothetical protein
MEMVEGNQAKGPMGRTTRKIPAVWLTTAALGSLLVGTTAAWGQPQITPKEMLSIEPGLPGVEFDRITDPAAVAACKVEVYEGVRLPGFETKVSGYALRDGQGRMLRRFLDTDSFRGLDRWSYYKDGFEVYREIDRDGNRTVDECWFLNSNGTRIARLEGGRITGWLRLSPEEVGKVLVQALVANDDRLASGLFATPEDLGGLGIPAEEIERVKTQTAQRKTWFNDLRAKLFQAGWNEKTVWLRFDGAMPRVIPRDAAPGLTGDVILYENAVVFAAGSDGSSDPARMAYLQVPELVKFGDVWKLIDHPQIIDPSQTQIVLASTSGGVRASIYSQAVLGGPTGMGSPDMEPALKALAEFDTANADKLAEMLPRDLATYYVKRVDLLRKVAAAAGPPQSPDRLLYERQVVDSLAAAYQTGGYPAGAQELDTLIAQGGPIASYAAFRKALARYALDSEEPGANLLDIQKRLLADLEAFVAAYPQSAEAPEALLQLANVNEFNADEAKAKSYYQMLAKRFPESGPGRKAQGALKRLELVGQPLTLSGTGLNGEAIDLKANQGRATLVIFWASWADQARRDLAEIGRLLARRAEGSPSTAVAVVSVNFDTEAATAEATLQAEGLNWPTIHDAGGMDGPIAREFGIMSLPTMFLVGTDGKVVSRSIRSAAELERQLERLAAAGGVALDGEANPKR